MRIRQLLDSGEFVATKDGLRPLQGRDIALLFRRLTKLEPYRQALVRWGIPHRVVGGRGFFESQEVLDVISFLKLLANPSDEVACLSILRSPWVALRDSSLVLLAKVGGGRIRFNELLRQTEEEWEGLLSSEIWRLQRFLQVFQQVHEHLLYLMY